MNNEYNYKHELSYISKYIGQDESLVQAGGGNTSIKIDDSRMLVKSSGIELSAVTDNSGFSIVDYRQVREALISDANDDSILKNALIEGLRPSIETYLHSLTDKYTIHSHPLCVTILVCQTNGMGVLKKLFPDAICVGYAKPGIELAKIFFHAIQKNSSAFLFFLKNHGLIVSGNSKEDVLKKHNDVINKLCGYLKISQDANDVAKHLFCEFQKYDNRLIAYHLENLKKTDLFRENKKSSYMFSPDCIVYCGMEFLVVKNLDALENAISEFIKQYGIPKVVIAKDFIFAITTSVRKAKEIESVLKLVAKINQRKIENVDFLSKEDAVKLLNWDAEKYRYNL